MNKNRLIFIDIAKSIGMFLIIWGHIYAGKYSHAFVYAFHIPLFFILSGMVFNRDRYSTFKTFFLKRVTSLLLPYAIFSVLTWMIWALYVTIFNVDVESIWMPLFQTILSQGSKGYLVHNVPLWFVTCLFVIEMFYFVISKLKYYQIGIISIFMVTLSHYLLNYTDSNFSEIPWSVDAAMLGLPFYALGHYFSNAIGINKLRRICEKKKVGILLFIITIAAVTLVSVYNGSISFGHTNMGKSIYMAYIGGVLGSIMILIASLFIEDFYFKHNYKIIDKIIWFGQNTFYAMVIHNPIKGFMCVIVALILHKDPLAVQYSLFDSIIVFVVTFAFTLLGVKIINCCVNYINNMNITAKRNS